MDLQTLISETEEVARQNAFGFDIEETDSSFIVSLGKHVQGKDWVLQFHLRKDIDVELVKTTLERALDASARRLLAFLPPAVDMPYKFPAQRLGT